MLNNQSSVNHPKHLATVGKTRATGADPMAEHFVRGDLSGDYIKEPAFGLASLGCVIIEHPKDVEIVAQGDRAEYCFEVVEGCLRTVKLLEDGRRQIGDFLLRGDVYGLDVIDEHEFSVETVTSVTLRRSRAKAVEDHLDQDRTFAKSLRHYIADQAKATRSRLVVLGRLKASERIAVFLLEMSKRLVASTDVALPMDRTDIADYLGLTIETVSRSLTQLRCKGVIAVKGPSIKIRDRYALQLLSAEYFA